MENTFFKGIVNGTIYNDVKEFNKALTEALNNSNLTEISADSSFEKENSKENSKKIDNLNKSVDILIEKALYSDEYNLIFNSFYNKIYDLIKSTSDKDELERLNNILNQNTAQVVQYINSAETEFNKLVTEKEKLSKKICILKSLKKYFDQLNKDIKNSNYDIFDVLKDIFNVTWI